MGHKLTPRELRFLKVMYPEGTVSIGLTVGTVLHHKGYLEMAKRDRYKLSRKGIIAVAAAQRQRPRTGCT
jgi:hypothetical protein